MLIVVLLETLLAAEISSWQTQLNAFGTCELGICRLAAARTRRCHFETSSRDVRHHSERKSSVDEGIRVK